MEMINSDMNSKERFFALFNDQDADRPAVINPVSVATSESATALGLDFSKVHLDAESTADLACYAHEKIGFDSIMPYFGVVQEAAALGAEIKWGDNQTMPTIRSHVFNEPEQIKVPADYLDRQSIRSLIDAVKIRSARHGEDALIIGKVMGPWTLCLNLYGVEETLISTIEDPVKLSEMLKALKEFARVLIEAQLMAGAHMVTVADHTTRNLVGPKVYDDFVKSLHKELNTEFPGKLMLHCCGFTEDRVGYFEQAGFPLYHFESANDIDNMLRLVKTMKLTGNINNPTVLFKGSREDVIENVKNLVSHGIDIISPECAVPMKTPDANLEAIVEGAIASVNNELQDIVKGKRCSE
jgi:[methyl-Co(III) methanol-specific corrinoid protein]:coenzyme M methyltransferase